MEKDLTLRFALAHVVDSRADFLETRKEIVLAETQNIHWLREGAEIVESDLIRNESDIASFSADAKRISPQALVIHLPVWGDPVLSSRLASRLKLPTLLLGNTRPDSSSIVGMLGAGGALDQIGYPHRRIIDGDDPASRRTVWAFLRAAAAVSQLEGMTLGLFGGRSLGIVTAGADAAQWQRLFGVDIETIDQLEIKQRAESYPADEVEPRVRWLTQRLAGVVYEGNFTPQALDRQMRSYLATRDLACQYRFDFIGVKCQPEMSNGYCTQCLAHMLCNSAVDFDGAKPLTIHACESDADGALTMQLLHLLSGGQPAALMDLRHFDFKRGMWTLANCGAIPPALAATDADADGFSGITATRHVFGTAGGGAFTTTVTPRNATLARLCRKAGDYWMAIVPAEIVAATTEELSHVTPAFPKALVRTTTGMDFLERFSSNHIHVVTGDLREEIIAFCQLIKIPYVLWD